MDARRNGHRADDDHAGAGAVLLRHGAQEEHACHDGAELCGGGARFDHLDDLRLRPRLHRRRRLHRLVRPMVPDRHHHDVRQPLREDDPRNPVHDLPDDVRDHHGGARRGLGRGEDALCGLSAVLGAVADLRLHADRALGVGRRLPRQGGPARLRRRHRGAHQCRHCGACGGADARQAARLRHRQPRAL